MTIRLVNGSLNNNFNAAKLVQPNPCQMQAPEQELVDEQAVQCSQTVHEALDNTNRNLTFQIAMYGACCGHSAIATAASCARIAPRPITPIRVCMARVFLHTKTMTINTVPTDGK